MADVSFGFVHDFGADEEFAARAGAGATLDGGPFELDPPDHVVILPFTRMLSGPMDYTPGIFDLLFPVDFPFKFCKQSRIVCIHGPKALADGLIFHIQDNQWLIN